MKNWLITGCSSGLGRSLAKEALEKGYNVVITARDIGKLKKFEDDFPKTALLLPLDVTDKLSVRQTVRASK